MAPSPKLYYALALIILVAALTGCELQRDESRTSDTASLGEITPPTLAPLGADSSELEADVALPPTAIDAAPTATISTLLEGDAAESSAEGSLPTTQPAVELSADTINNSSVEQAATEPERFIPAEQAIISDSVSDETAIVEPIIVDANPEELPSGGPIAANPPTSETVGDYSASLTSEGTYLVRAGDTLFGIGLRFGTTVDSIMLANRLKSETIYEGQVLNITGYDDSGYAPPVYDNSGYAPPPAYAPAAPVRGAGHVVASGETLFGIALRYGSSVDAVAQANGIPYPYIIQPGQYLKVPKSADNRYYEPPAGSGYYPGPNENPYAAAPDNNFYYPAPNDSGYYPAPQDDSYYPAPPDSSGYYPAPQDDSYYPAPPDNSGYYPAPQDDSYYPAPPDNSGYYQGSGDNSYYPAPNDNSYYPRSGDNSYYPAPNDNSYYPRSGDNSYYPAPNDNGYYPPAQFGQNPYQNNVGGGPGHTVATGETLHSIALRYGLTAQGLAAANGLSDPNQIFAGQVLNLP